MKGLFLALLFLSCVSSQPTTNPPEPVIVDKDTVRITLHDTVIVLHNIYVDTPWKGIIDTQYVRATDTIWVPPVTRILLQDTTKISIQLAPSPSGDSWQELQDAIIYSQEHPGHRIDLVAGNYYIYKPLIVATRKGNDYDQVCIRMEGPIDAKTAPGAFTANIIPAFTNAPALIIQQGKSCQIKNIAFVGKYMQWSSLNMVQIDTMAYSGWSDGVCTDGWTNPYAAIAIDPFSDPAYFDGAAHKMYDSLHAYYLSGMNRSGSTDIRIENCSFTRFVVGLVITPSYQQNGEEIQINDCSIEKCREGIATTQAQSKTVYVNRLMCWGGVHTLFGGAYGWGGATFPMVDGVNIAGAVHQLLNASSNAFPITMKRVYGEGLFKIGSAGGPAGTHFEDFQVDFQNGIPGVPSPDFYYYGNSTSWTNCQLRLYNGNPNQRIVLNCANNWFTGGAMSNPPFCGFRQEPGGGNSIEPPIFNGVTMYYDRGKSLNRNDYDSTVWQQTVTVHVNPDFTGYFLGNPGISVGDLIIGQKNFEDQFSNIGAYAAPVGFVTRVSGDTIFLSNTGLGILNGMKINVWDCKYKQ